MSEEGSGCCEDCRRFQWQRGIRYRRGGGARQGNMDCHRTIKCPLILVPVPPNSSQDTTRLCIVPPKISIIFPTFAVSTSCFYCYRGLMEYLLIIDVGRKSGTSFYGMPAKQNSFNQIWQYSYNWLQCPVHFACFQLSTGIKVLIWKKMEFRIPVPTLSPLGKLVGVVCV